jgi:hypothetical protein
MKEIKHLRPGWAGRRAHPSQFVQQSAVKAEAAMQTDAPPRKTGGRLSREDQRRLGDILQRVYDDVLKQGVPDRFKDLLKELEGGLDRPGPSHAESGSDDPAAGAEDRGSGEEGEIRDCAASVNGLARPGSEGSH